jgi:hypothetical protein
MVIREVKNLRWKNIERSMKVVVHNNTMSKSYRLYIWSKIDMFGVFWQRVLGMKDEMNDRNLMVIKMLIPFQGMLNEGGFWKSTKKEHSTRTKLQNICEIVSKDLWLGTRKLRTQMFVWPRLKGLKYGWHGLWWGVYKIGNKQPNFWKLENSAKL